MFVSNFSNTGSATSLPNCTAPVLDSAALYISGNPVASITKIPQYKLHALQLVLFSFLFIAVNAQHDCKLIIHPVSIDSQKIIELNLQTNFNDKANCLQYVQKLTSLLALKGFASASIDSLWEDSTSVSINLFAGDKYEWENLSVNDSNNILLSSLGYHRENFDLQNFSQAKLEQLYNDVLDYYSNNGYPFVTIFLDSIVINTNKLSARLNVQTGLLYHIDTVIVEGNIRISKFFLQRYLQIREHEIYRQ